MEKYYLYIVLSRPNTAVSKMIKLIKNDQFTHASISLDKDIEYMYSFGRRNTYNPFIGRFKQEDINEGIYRFHRDVPGLVMEVETTKEQYERAKILLDHFILNSDSYKYNYKGLIYNLLNKPVCKDDRFLCSEFVYYILNESYIADLKVSRNLVRPQNLLNIEGEIIYEGNLKQIRFPHQVKNRRLHSLMNKIGINF
ncbi:hypothetical protein GOQ27_07855 [Clostridium sp. D2Q-11]|uniref:Permuted papain-like amidase enzyme, YaeF/YiiX, C92 family n=1 Tax=Anaeromonas frigoriresistens TaxID=2683708 RepID=A0A942UVQ7_9FIRM|nr:hypothetical protein [Anaeromonas frigoriresistens]MBS4538375.1 hypothetical protein [Anaeromonas frigoriresistens]